MVKVYIAGPYSKGDTAINVRNAMELASQLIESGFNPYCPHLSHFLHLHRPQKYQKWLDIDLEWLDCCDYIIRLEGESNGADFEVEHFLKQGKVVFYSIDELIEYIDNLTEQDNPEA